MDLLTPLLDLLFPRRCGFCRTLLNEAQPGVLLCRSCEQTILNPQSCCSYCGYPLAASEDGFCPLCSEHSYAFYASCALSLFQGELRKAILRFKYGGKRELAFLFGQLMARQVRKCQWPALDSVVPIPLHPLKLRERGYDQALLLAQVLGKELDLPLQRILTRRQATVSQTTLSAAQRWQNVADVFVFHQQPSVPRRVLLVDDLLTTGATAHFAAEALHQAGVKEVYLAVIAHS
ncbi:MAG TPA: ComF family protein [Oscillospiraceae bacterium]|nr:ComF family protein [Oscillospiraceae bacterium]